MAKLTVSERRLHRLARNEEIRKANKARLSRLANEPKKFYLTGQRMIAKSNPRRKITRAKKNPYIISAHKYNGAAFYFKSSAGLDGGGSFVDQRLDATPYTKKAAEKLLKFLRPRLPLSLEQLRVIAA